MKISYEKIYYQMYYEFSDDPIEEEFFFEGNAVVIDKKEYIAVEDLPEVFRAIMKNRRETELRIKEQAL